MDKHSRNPRTIECNGDKLAQCVHSYSALGMLLKQITKDAFGHFSSVGLAWCLVAFLTREAVLVLPCRPRYSQRNIAQSLAFLCLAHPEANLHMNHPTGLLILHPGSHKTYIGVHPRHKDIEKWSNSHFLTVASTSNRLESWLVAWASATKLMSVGSASWEEMSHPDGEIASQFQASEL